jgi:endonuclease YncB( thermonuclease family)
VRKCTRRVCLERLLVSVWLHAVVSVQVCWTRAAPAAAAAAAAAREVSRLVWKQENCSFQALQHVHKVPPSGRLSRSVQLVHVNLVLCRLVDSSVFISVVVVAVIVAFVAVVIVTAASTATAYIAAWEINIRTDHCNTYIRMYWPRCIQPCPVALLVLLLGVCHLCNGWVSPSSSLQTQSPQTLVQTSKVTSLMGKRVNDEFGGSMADNGRACDASNQVHKNSRRAFFQTSLALLLSPIAATKANAATATSPATTTTITPLPTLPAPPILAPIPQSDVLGNKDNSDLSLILPQFQTVNDVPEDYFTNQKYIYAFVERIIDGDTMRVRHVPGFSLNRQVPEPLQTRGIANATLSVRVYGVDTPEIGKNKRQTSQAFAEEAKQFTTDLVYHKMVKITFLKKDQYNRAIACVETVPSLVSNILPGKSGKDLSIELAREGLAEIYTGGGAVYYTKKDELKAVVAEAQRLKKGQWSLSPEERQSAAAKKREMRAQQAAEEAAGRPIASNGERGLEAAMTGLEFAA